MTNLTIKLKEKDLRRLKKAAHRAGKSVQALINEWVSQLPDEHDEHFDVSKDPVFQMEGYDFDAPNDLSENLDKYLYGEEYPR
ncbi:hypothetical protein GWO43_02845 [candidate division KSB1 bacterium]|nr:hypothetical protein [candidate division KSB1 bacterium]NIR69868.1 hypothetical protein [candidate division KSB1 bacterium]NIS22987.1 hypothetical protein [candidate division KSB1 bacterium]NIT69845.1 hypothetical protein [candidate division KSB1 bacterium]NIU25767.1 hypothetical protein [candidate division KSB1 bacterium]